MKIASLAVVATAFLHLKSPTGEYLYDGAEKVGIDLYSPGSPESAQVEERQSARAVRRMQDNNNRIALAPIAQRRAEAAEDLADMTAGFHRIEFDGADGKPLSGRALHVAVYSDPSLGWIKEQAQQALGDWSRFTKGSANS